MTTRPRKRDVFANPFFTVMLATSVAFVLTVLAYLVSPSCSSRPPPIAASPRLDLGRRWIDRNAPMTLAVEFVIMLVTGLVAMVTDPWFTARSNPKAARVRLSMSRKETERRDHRATERAESAQLSLLCRSPAGDQRPRL